jgi:Siphovirus Gp157
VSTNPHLDFEVRRYKAIREALLKDNADDIDEQTLADTTEGLTDLHELLAAIVRGVLEDETMAGMIKVRLDQLSTRLGRFNARAERRRAIVRDAMLEAGVDKLAMPDFTVSTRKGPVHLVVTDEERIPHEFFQLFKQLDKRAVSAALKNGAHVPGAELSNPGMTLSVRTR